VRAKDVVALKVSGRASREEMMKTVHQKNRITSLAALAVSVVLLMAPSFARPGLAAPRPSAAHAALPRMVDLGRGQCAPCKMMVPVLEELKREYAGVIEIEYIDIAKNPDAMQKLGLPVRAVPFQIFYDGSGTIVRNHYGYMSKEEIVQLFKDLGFDRGRSGPPK
jgi:thioredoxin 1